MPRRATSEDAAKAKIAASYKKPRRKAAKVTSEAQLDEARLSWKKDYAAFLKAADFSYSYISDVVGVSRAIVKKWFQDPTQTAKVAEIQKDTVDGAINFLKRHSIELIEMLLDIARTEEDSTVKLRAVVEGLDRIGLAKVNKSESKVLNEDRATHEFSPEFFERLEGMPLETQKQLASLADEMEQIINSQKGEG